MWPVRCTPAARVSVSPGKVVKFARTALVAVLLTLGGCATPPRVHGIPNFAFIAPNVWCGGQPNAEGWAYLHSLGVTHDIKLNTDAEGDDAPAYQFMFVNKIPISIHEQLLGPSTNKINDAVWWATEYPFGVFIHCSHGEDRTGLVVAAYLHQVERWSKERARKYMLAHGFHRILLGLNWYWNQKEK